MAAAKTDKTPRQAVLTGLNSVFGQGGYSGIVLDHMVKEAEFDRRDIGFITKLFYGVLERSVTLDYCIAQYAGKPCKKLDLQVLNVLRMGLYQLKFMDAVPDSAAVNESVKLTAYVRKTSARGFVNAILRRFIRENKQFPIPDIQKDPLQALAVETACPKWILSLWKDQYGLEFAGETALAMLTPPPVILRVNPLVNSADALKEELIGEGFSVQEVPGLSEALAVTETAQSIEGLPSFRRGGFYVQDISSQWSVRSLGAKPGERILDICAAPGGKSIGAALDMRNSGEICSFDLYEHKAALIAENASRLGLSCIHAAVGDAACFNEALGLFDRVLCDVPCSGLGVLRRKPEIRLKDKTDVKAIPELQYRILCNAARYVRPDGVLVYSTCTVNREENADICLKFLKEHPEFELLPDLSDIRGQKEKAGITLLPQTTGSDGFYIARLHRK